MYKDYSLFNFCIVFLLKILFYKPVRTKYFTNLFKIRKTLGYQLFIAKQDTAQTPWLYLTWISKYLSLWLFFCLLACLSLSLGIVASYFETRYLLNWVLPNLLLLSLFAFLFFKFQQKGNQLYHQFMKAVEQRHQSEKNTIISPENTKILRQYLFKLQSAWWSLALLLLLLPLLGLAIHHYQSDRVSSFVASKTSKAWQQLINQKKTKIRQWQLYLSHTRLRIKTAQKKYVKAYTQYQQAAAAIQYQLNTLSQSQAQQKALSKFLQSLFTSPSLASKEALIKANKSFYAQAQGALEAQLALNDQSEAKAAQLLKQEGSLYEALQSLHSKQAHSIAKAQKALSQERVKREVLKEEMLIAKQLLANLLRIEDQYCHQKQKFEQDLPLLQKKHQDALTKEKHY